MRIVAPVVGAPPLRRFSPPFTVVGAFSFGRIGVDRFPKVDFPTVVVTTRAKWDAFIKGVKDGRVEFDDAGAIGRRYRRQDEIGTPFCVTVDFDTLDDNAVTVRERDTMSQERVSLDRVEMYLLERLPGC